MESPKENTAADVEIFRIPLWATSAATAAGRVSGSTNNSPRPRSSSGHIKSQPIRRPSFLFLDQQKQGQTSKRGSCSSFDLLIIFSSSFLSFSRLLSKNFQGNLFRVETSFWVFFKAPEKVVSVTSCRN